MIVIGLGNPGSQYARTRHNVGFAVIDRLAKRVGAAWKHDRTKSVQLASCFQHLLIKPSTFMNCSGQAFMTFWKYRQPDRRPEPGEIMVVHDDVDLPVGIVRQQIDRSAAGHRGVASVIEALGTQSFHRLRIGVGNNRDIGLSAEDYVLQPLSHDELQLLSPHLDTATQMLVDWLGLPPNPNP